MSSETITALLYAIPALLIAISLHEMMHSLVAYWLGDDTAKSLGRISLNPIKHIDPVTTVALPLVLVLLGFPPFAAAKPVPIDTTRLHWRWGEFGMAIVGVAGPLTNLLLAIIATTILKLVDPSGWLLTFLLMNIAMNVGLFVFNMIPFPPLDGSRLLYALAPDGVRKFMMQIESQGFMAIALFMFVGFPLIRPALETVQEFIFRMLGLV